MPSAQTAPFGNSAWWWGARPRTATGSVCRLRLRLRPPAGKCGCGGLTLHRARGLDRPYRRHLVHPLAQWHLASPRPSPRGCALAVFRPYGSARIRGAPVATACAYALTTQVSPTNRTPLAPPACSSMVACARKAWISTSAGPLTGGPRPPPPSFPVHPGYTPANSSGEHIDLTPDRKPGCTRRRQRTG